MVYRCPYGRCMYLCIMSIDMSIEAVYIRYRLT